MSRSQPTHTNNEDIQTYKYYPKENKPIPGMYIQPKDKYYYDRWKAAERLGKKHIDLEDEPDNERYDLKEKEIYDEPIKPDTN